MKNLTSYEPRDSSRASRDERALKPPRPPTAQTPKTPTAQDQAAAFVDQAADNLTKLYRENPDYEVPY
jgi:hypothetical protein